MNRTPLSLLFLAAPLVVGLSAKQAVAQHFDTVNTDHAQRENDVLIHQDIVSGRIAAPESADRTAVHTPIERAVHPGRKFRNTLRDVPVETNPEELARQSRLLCEQEHGSFAAQWRCRPHAQQR
jgi:hypothetical protein